MPHSQIDASLSTGKTHPGYDCFVIHSSIVDRVRLGNLFAGYPPWGSVLAKILKIVTPGSGLYTNIQSNPNATFHLGDRGTWSKKKLSSSSVLEILESVHNADIEDCPKPLFSEDPYTYVNTANCGRIFREEYYQHRGGK